MKEQSIEQKAEAYDKAIEGIQEILSSGQDSIKMSRLQLRLQGIFPELKENEDGPFSCEHNVHLWNVTKDAKEGDVLFHSDSASNGIFIFKEIIDKGFAKEIICYCDYDSEDHFCLGEHHTCCWADAKILHPATKEQRGLLFQKMKEAGYEWDAEKKELKKIEQNPAWSEEDEEYLRRAINATKDTYPMTAKWLKSLKQRIGG